MHNTSVLCRFSHWFAACQRRHQQWQRFPIWVFSSRACRQWRHSVTTMALVLFLFSLISACGAPPRTQSVARSTAEVAQCWPYTAPPQPATPTPLPRGGTFDPTKPTYPPQTPITAYPPCPIPAGVPTHTPTPLTDPTPFASGALGEPTQMNVKQGKNTNLAAAVHPHDGRVVAGYVSWSNSPTNTADDGEVWVKAQASGVITNSQVVNNFWQPPIKVNTTPVNRLVGGLGITFGLSNTVTVAWGDGRSSIYTRTSLDAGKTWEPTQVLGSFAYQVVDLTADMHGGLHLLTLTPNPHYLRYSYRPPHGEWLPPVAVAGGREHLKGNMAVLVREDGTVRRFVTWTVAHNIHLAASDDGITWMPIPVTIGSYMYERQPDFPFVMAAPRHAGDVVMLAWSQYSAGGLFAMTSLDGGATWGPQEQVVQHMMDGSCERGSGTSCGYHPSLGYDPASDRVALVWQHVIKDRDIQEHETEDYRTRLAWRSLDPDDGIDWRFAITPDHPLIEDGPVLGSWKKDGNDGGWGKRCWLFSAPNHDHHMLMCNDDRNQQNRVWGQKVGLFVWLAEGAS